MESNILIERTLDIKKMMLFLSEGQKEEIVDKSLGKGDWGQQRFKNNIIDTFEPDDEYDEARLVTYPIEELKSKFKKEIENDILLMPIIESYMEIDSGYYDGSDERKFALNNYFIQLAEDGIIFRDYELCEDWVEESDFDLERVIGYYE